MADFHHVAKGQSQQHKHHKSHRSKSGGKVESRHIIMGSRSNLEQGKHQRFNAQTELRKLKREELIMKRRGLNFVTEHHEELLDQSTITVCEEQLDNVAPKIVGLLQLGASCDTN